MIKTLDPKKGVLGVDIETKSVVDLPRIGQWAYSEDESTDVYCVVFGYAEKEGEYEYFDWEPGTELPRDIRDFILYGGRVVAHNASFEFSIWQNILGDMYSFPSLTLHQLDDTQVLGMALNLPPGLDGLAQALGCPTQKDTVGKALMLKMCKLVPDGEGGRTNAHDTPANRERLVTYCRDDVGATLDCYFRLKPLDETEAQVYEVDKQLNARGVYLDREFAEDCTAMVLARKAELDTEVRSGTTDWRSMHLANSVNPYALKAFLKAHDVPIPTRNRKKKKKGGGFTYAKSASTDQAAVAEMLALPDLHPDVTLVLRNRQESTKATSLAKLGRVNDMVGRDGRLRYALWLYGANTARWTSSGLQVHNLPKDKLGPLSDAVRACIRARDLEGLKFLSDRPLEAISSCLRSVISAPTGREIIAADWSAIEARVVAWLAGQEDVLATCRRGEDIYVKAARDVGSDNRHLGKICTLALGYSMGLATFIESAAGYDVTLSIKEARRILKAWRDSNSAIVSFWREIEEAAKNAIGDPGTKYSAGLITAVSNGGCLGLVLPSGRVIRYWRPSLVMANSTIKMLDDDGTVHEKEIRREEIRFYTLGNDKKSMVPATTYGGKLAENVTQAVARDLLAAATVRINPVDSYDLIVHVHDSLAAEVDKGEGSVAEFERLLTETPYWAAGLPLAAEGYRSKYFKG